jgi:hypothetical protein
MLTLTIKKKWFDMILPGEKKEEYRECSRYYFQRFRKHLGCKFINGERVKDEFMVRLRNGYDTTSPSVVARCTVRLGSGKPEWGAEPGKGYYVLSILSLGPDR